MLLKMTLFHSFYGLVIVHCTKMYYIFKNFYLFIAVLGLTAAWAFLWLRQVGATL